MSYRLRASAVVLFLIATGCGECGYDPAESTLGADGASADGMDGAMVDRDAQMSLDTSQLDSSAMDGSPTDGSPVDGTTGADTEGTVDARFDGAVDGASDGGDRCEGGRSLCDGTCVDRSTNPNHCGACGQTCSGNEVCTDGACRCPRYHERCDGACVSTQVQADNCGRCGNSCDPTKVCSAGTCADSCLEGRESCGQRCVDQSTNPDHCGACGNECAWDKGCQGGACESAVVLGDAPDKCSGGGPQIEVDAAPEGQRRCTGNLAEEVFLWGVCSCDSLVFDDALQTDAYDSTLGRYEPGGLGAGVGTNADIDVGSQAEIRGSLWASSMPGAVFDDGVTVHQQLHVGGNLDTGSTAEFKKDAWVESNVEADGAATFGQTLHVTPNSTVSSGVNYGSLDDSTDFDVQNACTQCGAADRIPVSEIVDRHTGADNDNSAVGLSPDAMDGVDDGQVLELPCGEYYLSKMNIDDTATIRVTGRTALYIGGDVEVGSNLTIKPAANAELDVFIDGNVTIDDRVELGDAAYPASTRFYVGGDKGWDFGSQARMAGYIYAVPGGIVADDGIELYGGMYTQNLDAGSDVDIHYDRAILGAGKNCTPVDQPDPDPEPTGDAGMSDASGAMDGQSSMDDSGGTSGDGGDTAGDATGDTGGDPAPTCSESGETCSGDGDCCVPLVCGAQGTCDVKECRALYESCTEDADCCTGTCSGSGSDKVCISS